MGLERWPGIVMDRRLSHEAGAVQFFTEEETMLMIRRKEGEAFTVGEARIVIKRSGKTVRIGIEAPKEVKVLREELIERKEAA
jgi:carbon storage regulator CsrA